MSAEPGASLYRARSDSIPNLQLPQKESPKTPIRSEGTQLSRSGGGGGGGGAARRGDWGTVMIPM